MPIRRSSGHRPTTRVERCGDARTHARDQGHRDVVRHDPVRGDGPVRQARIGYVHRRHPHRALHTGRRKVLSAGTMGGATGRRDTPAEVKDRRALHPVQIHLNDATSFGALVDAHRGEIAAVTWSQPPRRPHWMTPRATPTRRFATSGRCLPRLGCVLIFDEIVTGFRYPHGSVQRATGVIPDLACLGKALDGGMPLSALVGRRAS